MNKASGAIRYINKTYQDLPNRDFGKYRYLQIEGFPETIELFIGKESGDFKPDLEKIDELKVGEEVTVYYSDGINSENDGIQRLVQYIDRGREPVFKKGSWDKTLGFIVAASGGLILVGLFVLRKFGKI
ncbi:hypothetical protein [Desertivirga xinjiangensis]|uniref:hypothetical protein n=1 Tax=Desertivirga xinjiangensis TaxID=539206 RepID=UPI00210B8A3C|nr:hypothetical protein [Pedobacter xinjiangensis]